VYFLQRIYCKFALLSVFPDSGFYYNNSMSDIQIVDAPAGVEGAGFFATSLDKVVG
jgi:hypothetical protein